MKRIITIFVLVFTLSVSAFAKSGLDKIQVNYSNVKLYVHNREVRTVVDPIIYQDSVYLPAEAISQIFDLDYLQNDSAIYLYSLDVPVYDTLRDQTTQKVGAETIFVIFNDVKIFVNNHELYELSREAFNYKGNLYLPVKTVFEALGFSVDWDANSKAILVD